MMKSVLLITVAVLLLIVISACGGGSEPTISPTSTPSSTTTTQSVSPIPTPSSTLSEQPDTATYLKYFSELGIGKMPPEVNNPAVDLQKNASVFTADDLITLYGTAILECQIRSAIYNVSTGKVVREGSLPQPVIESFAGWDPVDLPVGKYEYKIYVGDILVGVFPFEVR